MASSIGISLLGGTGYGAGELLRLLVNHPNVTVTSVVSSSAANTPISSVHRHLSGFYDSNFASSIHWDELELFTHRFLVTALPHGTSGATIRDLIDDAEAHGVKIIDLSGDIRLEDPTQRSIYYPEAKVSDELQSRFVYGLTELQREKISSAMHIANPGCYATLCALSAAPIVQRDMHQDSIIFDGKSGSSGAGRALAASFHHPERHANVNAYKILSHRHEPEIRQALGDPAGSRISTAFVPHVIPISRGMYVTAFMTLRADTEVAEIVSLYRSFYQDSPFVRVLDTPVELSSVVGSNFCDLSISVRGRQLVVTGALDNLVKGMTGQAIQNMNLQAGIPETTGLWFPAVSPV